MSGLLCPTNMCKFCEDNCSKYVCPRCNAPYCSVECYKSPHHSDCSEAFYKECVEEEMRVREPDPETRKSMMDILMRHYEENVESESEDSDDDTDLEERLRGINLDNSEEVWSKLTPEERKEFLELANAGDITKLVPIWEPWWMNTHRKPKVRFSECPDTHDSYKSSCPTVKSDIAVLNTLSKSNPSPLIFNNVLNVIAAYAMTARFFNGECSNSSLEASSLLLSLSKNLSNNITFDTLDLAIESVSTESINVQVLGANQENIHKMKNDVAKIALGPNTEETSYYVLAALSDIDFLLLSAFKTKQPSLNCVKKTSLPVVFEKTFPINFSKKQFMLAEKKIQYYLSWVSTCYSEIVCQYKNNLSS